MALRHRSSGFPYALRAQAVEAARRACLTATSGLSEKRRTEAMRAALILAGQDFQTAMASAYPPDFWSNLDRLKSGEPDAVDPAVEFLEADPLFFRSGYTKAKIAKALTRVSLKGDHQERLIDAILSMVDRRYGYEYREISKLASTVANDRFIRELKTRLTSPDHDIGRRARWMLKAVEPLAQERLATLTP
jgi:hypothetical protein